MKRKPLTKKPKPKKSIYEKNLLFDVMSLLSCNDDDLNPLIGAFQAMYPKRFHYVIPSIMEARHDRIIIIGPKLV